MYYFYSVFPSFSESGEEERVFNLQGVQYFLGTGALVITDGSTHCHQVIINLKCKYFHGIAKYKHFNVSWWLIYCLLCMHTMLACSHHQACLTLCNPIEHLQSPLSVVSGKDIRVELPFRPPGDLLNKGIKIGLQTICYVASFIFSTLKY